MLSFFFPLLYVYDLSRFNTQISMLSRFRLSHQPHPMATDKVSRVLLNVCHVHDAEILSNFHSVHKTIFPSHIDLTTAKALFSLPV